MTLFDQITGVYPELADATHFFTDGTIVLQDDSDGNGPYIKVWNHPSLPLPDFT